MRDKKMTKLTKEKDMSDFLNHLLKLDSKREDRWFASKRVAFYIYLPCLIALGHGLLMMAIDPVVGIPSLLMGSALSIVCGSICENREKIIRQDKALQQLQERYEMLEQKEVATKSRKRNEVVSRGEIKNGQNRAVEDSDG